MDKIGIGVHNVRGRPVQNVELVPQHVRMPAIVGIEKRDDLARCDAQAGVPGGGSALVRLVNQTAAGRGRIDRFFDRFAIGRTIVDHDHFVSCPRLCGDGGERRLKVRGAVDGNDDADTLRKMRGDHWCVLRAAKCKRAATSAVTPILQRRDALRVRAAIELQQHARR